MCYRLLFCMVVVFICGFLDLFVFVVIFLLLFFLFILIGGGIYFFIGNLKLLSLIVGFEVGGVFFVVVVGDGLFWLLLVEGLLIFGMVGLGGWVKWV